MQKFLLKLGCFVSIQIAILSLVVLHGSRDATSNEYMYSLKDKYDLLKETPSPRIIFVGGSNLAFGLKSEVIKSKLNFNPINLGVHGRLGIYSMLAMVKEQLREGDVVVIAPEYGLMFSHPKCSEEMGIEAVNAWPDYQRFIESDFDVPFSTLLPPRDPMRELARCVASAAKNTRGLKTDCAIYRRASFNEFGDHAAHYDLVPDRQPHDDINGIIEGVFDEVAVELRGFHQHCLANNASVFYIHPPVRATNAKNHSELLDRMETLLVNNIDFPMLSTWREAMLDDSMFYDSKYHLNGAGAQLRSETICRQIRSYDRVAKQNGQQPIIR